jgi:hypothetical protein
MPGKNRLSASKAARAQRAHNKRQHDLRIARRNGEDVELCPVCGDYVRTMGMGTHEAKAHPGPARILWTLDQDGYHFEVNSRRRLTIYRDGEYVDHIETKAFTVAGFVRRINCWISIQNSIQLRLELEIAS